MHKIIPCLWFDDKAEEIAKCYAPIFRNLKIGGVTRYGKEGYEIHRREAGTIMTMEFEIEGQKFVALNGGSIFLVSGRGILNLLYSALIILYTIFIKIA
jgi:predicted 3-demethylubiquinone-9 3-methyltransferase (glyoxalase superfamily)